MDCSLTKTVNRLSGAAANIYSGQRELSKHAIYLSLSHQQTDSSRCHSWSFNEIEPSESNAHLNASNKAGRLLKNSQNRYEYNAFTLFTHSLARVLVHTRLSALGRECMRHGKYNNSTSDPVSNAILFKYDNELFSIFVLKDLIVQVYLNE